MVNSTIQGAAIGAAAGTISSILGTAAIPGAATAYRLYGYYRLFSNIAGSSSPLCSVIATIASVAASTAAQRYVERALNQSDQPSETNGSGRPNSEGGRGPQVRLVLELFSGPQSQLNRDVIGNDALIYTVDVVDYGSGRIQVDARDLYMVPDNSVDEVFVTNPFDESMRNAGRAAVDQFRHDYFAEIARVLRPGGRVVVSRAGDNLSQAF